MDLVSLANDARNFIAALTDPVAGGAELSSAVDAVRTLVVHPGAASGTPPNLILQSPSDGVPRPSAMHDQAAGSVDSGLLPVSTPLAPPGPPGPPGDVGPVGPGGPPGPGIEPARFLALEAAVADLQDQLILGDIITAHTRGF